MSTIYDAVCNSEFVEELHQTDAREFWFRAIAVLKQFLADFKDESLLFTHNPQILLSNVPLSKLNTWVFTPSFTPLLTTKSLPIDNTNIVRLSDIDSLQGEWFCLVLNKSCNILVVSSEQSHSCLISLHPEPVKLALKVLQQKIENPSQLVLLSEQLQRFPTQMPPYKVVARLGTLLMMQPFDRELPIPEIQEVEIIKAITHEVKTPLATIRTLAHSLLRRKDVTGAIETRLKQIVMECTEQIERFGLIFEAAQLAADRIHLETTHLEDIVLQNLGRWQEQAIRRQLTLSVAIPSNVPPIISNSKLLNQLLNGLIDKLTRSLPTGSHILLNVTAAGEHLKMQFESQLEPDNLQSDSPILKAVGQWLMLQPETGTLSLSLPIVKTLFQALGGKLTVRLHPTRADYNGEILTIFLPICTL